MQISPLLVAEAVFIGSSSSVANWLDFEPMDSTIPDEILIKNFDDFASMVPLTAKQVGIILGRSADQLSDDRASGRPPPFYTFERSERYTLSRVLGEVGS